MSEVSTLLAWLIPCLIIAIAIIAWRIYVYKTRGPSLPSSLRRNIFARTSSFLPRTLSFGSNRNVHIDGDSKIPTGDTALPQRNETHIEIPENTQEMATPVAPVSNNASSSQATQNPAITRLLSMK
ncbi:hypothetical protein BGZ76_011770 [Entomortierella beljakovae]|nr:hypothetical protein BGZ76_011770 [Entomortierella beljakovae]